MGLDCRARIIIGIPLIDREVFYTLKDVGTYSCSSGHDFKKKTKFCPECGKQMSAIKKRIFTDLFLDYCKSIKKSPDSVIDSWEDNWSDPSLRIHNVDEIAWTGCEAGYEVLGIRVLETKSHREQYSGDRKCLDQAAVDLAFEEMKKLGKHFYSHFDVDLYLSLNVSA